MKITVTKNITDDVLQVLESTQSLRNAFTCIGGFLNDGYHDCTKKQILERVDQFLKETDSIDLSDIIYDMKNED